MIENLAQRLVKAGMGTPALLFLIANKPLGRLGGNALHLFSPFVGVFIPDIDVYGYLLQDPTNLEIFVDRLQELEEERALQQRALRDERKARAKARKARARGLLPPEGPDGAGETPPPEGSPGGDDKSPVSGDRA